VIDHATVAGHAATVTETAQIRCVTWAPNPGSGLQVCSDTKPAKVTGSVRLSETELLQVAGSLN
jgi:hypothetical protein